MKNIFAMKNIFMVMGISCCAIASGIFILSGFTKVSHNEAKFLFVVGLLMYVLHYLEKLMRHSEAKIKLFRALNTNINELIDQQKQRSAMFRNLAKSMEVEENGRTKHINEN